MSKFSFGLVVGKFDPYHKGHEFLIKTATEQCSQVLVLVVDSAEDSFPAIQRLHWITACPYPVVVETISDIYDDDNSQAWADHTLKYFREYGWDLYFKNPAVFTSESYGDAYAEHMGFTHVSVDPPREIVPISATEVRDNIFQNWDFIPRAVQADLYARVVLIGAESTGTTTVAKALGKAMHTTVVGEYGRFYSECFDDVLSHQWHDDEFTHIAYMQSQMERQLVLSEETGFVICDTDSVATSVFHQLYVDNPNWTPGDFSSYRNRSLYLITSPDDVPYVQDGLRKEDSLRPLMHDVFIGTMLLHGLEYLVLEGDLQTRINTAFLMTQQFLGNFQYSRGPFSKSTH
jgi:NadR type nicotinamide-nucleotide adenylyltransferase